MSIYHLAFIIQLELNIKIGICRYVYYVSIPMLYYT